MIEDSYSPCDSCGNWIDDGSYRDSDYLCHDCLNKEHYETEKTMGVSLKMDINYAVVERIRSLCEKRGITRGELVKLSGANQATVYEIVGGRSKHPSINTLYKIANAFDMSLSQFFDDPLFTEIKRV